MPVKTTTFALRPFSGAGETLTDTPSIMVLDGQQRLTSLFQSLFSRQGVKSSDGRSYFFYLDVDHLMTDSDGSIEAGDPLFEDSLFFVQDDRKRQRIRYDGLTPRYDVATSELELENGAFPLNVLFTRDGVTRWRDSFLEARANENMKEYIRLQGLWGTLVEPWLHRIRDYPFPVIELRPDMPLSAICHIFEKVNSTGVPLSVFDLCTAILWAQEFKLNDQWKVTKRKFDESQTLRMQGDLEGANFLQVISLLDSLERKQAAPDSRIAVNCRRDDLLKLKAEMVKRWWPIVEQAYRESSKFMEAQGMINRRIVPYSTMIIPLAAIFGHIRTTKGALDVSYSWPKIEQWYWCSVFSQRYSSSVEANAAVDFEQVINWIDGGVVPDVVRTFAFQADRLQELTTIRNVVYKGILCLLTKGGARDFAGGGSLSVNLFHETSQDHHHIFPKAALHSLGIKDPRSESLVNKTLIGAATNRSIGGRLPSSYVSNLASRLGEPLVNTILRSHRIAPEALSRDDWNSFVLSRREELRQLIQETCGGNVLPFSDGEGIPLSAQVQRLSNDVEDIELRLRTIISRGLNGDATFLPGDIQQNVKDRMARAQKENPGFNDDHYRTLAGKLEFCELRELEPLIKSRQTWDRFAATFASKELLATRFRQFANLRNAIRHSRTIDELTRVDGEAAIIWFKSALAKAEATAAAAEEELEVEWDLNSDAVPSAV